MGCPDRHSFSGCGYEQRLKAKIAVLNQFASETRAKPEVNVIGVPGGITTGSITQGAGSIAQVGGQNNSATVNNFTPPERHLGPAGPVYKAIGIEKYPHVLLGGLVRTETRPAPIPKFQGARVGHQP